MKRISLPSYNVNLVDYFEIFKKKTDKHIINDLHSMDLLTSKRIHGGRNLSLHNKQVKSVFMHHIIQDMCDFVINLPSDRRNLVVYTSQLTYKLEIFDYINELKFVDFVEKLLKRFSKLLPINIYFNGMSAKEMHRIVKDKNGDSAELCIMLSNYIDRQVNRRLDYTKLSKITKKYGLTFLSRTYFKKVENKQLIFM